MATGVALVMAFGSATAGTAFAAPALASTLYVDNTNSACSNAGSGTAAVPFCTIQAAANVVAPGQTVMVDPNATNLNAATWSTYNESVNVTQSGTPAAPITFTVGATWSASAWGDDSSPAVTLAPAAGQSLQAGFNLSGVHDVVINGFGISGTSDDGVAVNASSDITINHDLIGPNGSATPQYGVSITGASSNVAVTRSSITAADRVVQVGAGAANTTVSANQFNSNLGAQVSISGATGTAVTGNSWGNSGCQNAIDITGSSASTTIEDNTIYGNCSQGSAAAEITVIADATAKTTLDYNVTYRTNKSTLYAWAGTNYASAAALTTANGQAAHDVNVSPLNPDASADWPMASAVIDSADALAPGELPTDINGDARADDPLVANTGTGSGFYDRGAYEAEDPLSIDPGFLSATQAPTGGTVSTAIKAADDSWSSNLTESVTFGDGTAATPAPAGVATHSYSAPGIYTVTATVTDPLGGTAVQTQQITIVTPVPFSVHATPTTFDANSVSVNFAGTTDSWNNTGGTFNPGDGTAVQQIGPNATGIEYTYAKPGTYTVTVTLTDAGGNSATTSTKVTTAGSDYTAYGPVRLLDTRNGTGIGGKAAKVPAAGTVKLQITGNGAIPSGVTAVTLNLTAANTTGSGFVTAYADGTSTPNASNLNYSAGRTVPNSIIVPVGTDGAIDLTNGGGGAGQIDLIADVTGYFTQTAGSGYTALSPNRLLDTRTGLGTATAAKVPAGSAITLSIAGADGGNLPASGITAVALNVTTTNTTGSGFISVYPDGTSTPNVSNLNYVPGQTVANAVIVPVGSDGKIDLFNGGGTAGAVDLLADVTGYFSAGSTSAYVPITPTRILDTRRSTALGAGGTVAVNPNEYLPDSFSAPNAHDPATGFVVNTTVTGPTGTGFITTFPDGATVPNVSTLNYTPNLTIANLALVTPGSGTDQKVDFFNGGATAGSTQLIVDLFGYFSVS